MIFLMVVIGGITRLTGSGLSITEWNVVMGALPPMSQNSWNEVFDKYKQTPQFEKINSQMTVDDFKSIFWWEYIHRLVGRLMGAVFLIPFIWFLLKRKLDKPLIKKLLILFALGGLQGFLGWFMVKSGLVNNTHVSHYRLAIHLVTAFATFAFTFWIALDLRYAGDAFQQTKRSLRIATQWLLGIVVLQIIYGAFVAGLHAGKFYTTFPTMDGEWMPHIIVASSSSPLWQNFTESIPGVQFVHRIIAYVILITVTALLFYTRKQTLSNAQKAGVAAIVVSTVIQITLGIFTLLHAAPISLSALHQIGAFGLFASCVYFLHRLLK